MSAWCFCMPQWMEECKNQNFSSLGFVILRQAQFVNCNRVFVLSELVVSGTQCNMLRLWLTLGRNVVRSDKRYRLGEMLRRCRLRCRLERWRRRDSSWRGPYLPVPVHHQIGTLTSHSGGTNTIENFTFLVLHTWSVKSNIPKTAVNFPNSFNF